MKRILFLCLLAVVAVSCLLAQPRHELRLEAQTTVAGGDNNPLWLNANKYGLSLLETSNG